MLVKNLIKRSHVCATSAKTGHNTAEGPHLNGFVSRGTHRTRFSDQGTKIKEEEVAEEGGISFEWFHKLGDSSYLVFRLGDGKKKRSREREGRENRRDWDWRGAREREGRAGGWAPEGGGWIGREGEV